MIKTNLFNTTPAHKIVDHVGCFSVLEYEKDLSVSPGESATAYFSSQMNVRKRQIIANLQGNSVIIQAGAMQLMIGDIRTATNVKGVGDFMKKFVGSKVTGESTIKPVYTGNGLLVFEPTYKYILMEDLNGWNGNMVIEDGLFLACDGTVKLNVVSRTNFSSAALGGEGLFNTALSGNGTVVLESPVPKEELIIVDMEDDILKIDGNMAIAWSNSLQFTVEKSTKTLVGSAASGEGLVNVYRGSGRVLIAPVAHNPFIRTPKS